MSSAVNILKHVPENFKAAEALKKTVQAQAEAAGIDALLFELIQIRASQINGCAYCLNVHMNAAVKNGEKPARLGVVSAWRETEMFSDKERAALELTETLTRMADSHIPDSVYDGAAEHLNQDEMAAVQWIIGLINLYNRIVVVSKMPVK